MPGQGRRRRVTPRRFQDETDEFQPKRGRHSLNLTVEDQKNSKSPAAKTKPGQKEKEKTPRKSSDKEREEG